MTTYSLQAAWVRNTFIRILRESPAKVANNLSPNFVYDRPTVSGISDYIYASVIGNSHPSRDTPEKKGELSEHEKMVGVPSLYDARR